MNLGKLERMPCLLQQHVNGKIKLRIVTLELVVKTVTNYTEYKVEMLCQGLTANPERLICI